MIASRNDYEPFLFNLELAFEKELANSSKLSPGLRGKFEEFGLRISRTATILSQAAGCRWVIKDVDTKKEYIITKKEDKLCVYSNLHIVNQIVNRDLCVRCGACEPACPVDIIKFDDRAYPYIVDDEMCIATCTRCLKVCPGEFVDFDSLDKEMFGAHPHPASITGVARQALVSFSTDQTVRGAGASGGFVTQILLYMMEKGLIDGALVLGRRNDGDPFQAQSFVARSPEELRYAAKSKYMVVPFLKPLAEIEQIDGKYAVVGLPCYIHALRKYQKVSRRLSRRIKLVIGLQCNVAFEPYTFEELCEFRGIKQDVVNLDFRHGNWPGGIVAQLRDGTARKLLKLEEWKDEFNLLKMFYTAPRCNMCVDFSAEYADLSVGDPWLRGRDGKYLFEDGRTSILVRTKAGEEIVRMASADGAINVKAIPLKTWMINFESHARYKRDFVPKAIQLRKVLGLSTPEYHRAIDHGPLLGFVPMLLKTFILTIAGSKWFRKLGLRLAQTQLALAYFAGNRRRKAERFAAAYPRIERFVERFFPGDRRAKQPSEATE